MKKSGNKILYHPLVLKNDISKIDKKNKERTKNAIEEKLSYKPEIFGLPLRGTLKKYWKLRVGDYRIVFKIEKTKVYILAIIHRKEVYDISEKRI